MGIASEYLKMTDYADVTPVLVGTTEEWWIDGARSIFHSHIKEIGFRSVDRNCSI